MTKKKTIFLCISSIVLVAFLGAALFGQSAPKENIYRYLSVFTEVFSLVKSNYVEDVPSNQLIDGAFAGVTDAVDEYSYYIPPAQMTQYRGRVADATAVTGLVVSRRYGYGYVISTVSGSPAEKAGLLAGDFIEKIDSVSTQKMPLWQIESALSKPDATSVKVTVLRGGMSKRSEFNIVRGPYAAPLPKSSTYGSVAYIKVPHFAQGSAQAFSAELEKVRKSGAKKLIVDVRGNADGSAEEAIAAADSLLRDGMITSLLGRKVEAKKWTADKATNYDGELIVLVDQSTAAAGEVFASAILGNKRGRLVGVSTYGKAISQKFVTLPSGGGLNITVGHYTTPDSKPIKETGVKPDVLVDLTPLFLEQKDQQKKSEDDLILKKALSLFGEAQKPEKAAA